MNNKGQMGIAGFFGIFIGVIVGLTLLTASATQVGQVTSTFVEPNTTQITAPAVGDAIDLRGQDLIDTPVVYNASSSSAIDAGNYTIQELISNTTGVKTISYSTNANSEFAGDTLNITYTAGGDGYADDSGARSLASLIIVFFALAIAVVAMSPTLRSGILDFK